MSLIGQLEIGLGKLLDGGWGELLVHHGLDLSGGDLRQSLLSPLNGIDRSIPGFEDFAPNGSRAIEPGNPSHSLLYHALASPNVQVQPNGLPLTKFPDLNLIDLVENLVFGIETPTLEEISQQVSRSRLSVVVFACDYRPSRHTSHRRYADIMFSRTGISRVGTASAEYIGKIRGFIPFVDSDFKGVRVLPARYGAYLAVQRRGSEREARPMRFQVGDSDRNYWVPVHKLFDGDECIDGIQPLELSFSSKHLNEKLRRIHLDLQRKGVRTSFDDSDLQNPPFQVRSGLAEFGDLSIFPKGLLVPVPHTSLVEKAMFNNQPATFPVVNGLGTLSSSLFLSSDKSAPEFVHARHLVEADGSITSLNSHADVANRVDSGGYNAQHYLDFTADGAVSIACPQLDGLAEIEGFEAAYSLVTPPDFYPMVDQRELTEWSDRLTQAVPGLSKNDIWGLQPEPLCDDRLPANLQFPDFSFKAREDTITAVIGLERRISGDLVDSSSPDPMRHSNLPDDAAGLFDPGWDVSTTTDINNIEHLSAFGLGSPFPEDAKLCAAITAFWPAVAPDIVRSIQPIRPGERMKTVSPLTDEEIGLDGGFSWDGVEPLKILQTPQGEMLEYASFDQTDYVEQALSNELTISVIGRISAEEYQNRVLAMALFYKGVAAANEINHGENASLIYSFKQVSPSNTQLLNAQQEAGIQIVGSLYLIKASSLRGQQFTNIGGGRVTIPISQKIESYVSSRFSTILFKDSNDQQWRAVQAL